MDAKKVGKSIAFLRNYYGMTQRDLADCLGVTDKAVSRWERGKGIPEISLLTKLSIILDTDIESILEGNITHLGLAWKGVLNLDYAEGIWAGTQMFGKWAVSFQLSFLMLAGIKDILIRGKQIDIDFTRSNLGNGLQYGIDIRYETTDQLELIDVLHSEPFREMSESAGVMLVNGLDFLYGKDVTKYFRRVIYDSKYPVRMVNFEGKATSIYFFPDTIETRACLDGDASKNIRKQVLERGIIVFPIITDADVLDAATIIRILEEHQDEKVSDLDGIAVRRTLIHGQNIEKL